MKKIYYVVTKQIDDIDGFGETNGLKDVTAYSIKDNELVKIAELEIENSENSKTSLLEYLEEEGLIESDETIQLIQL